MRGEKEIGRIKNNIYKELLEELSYTSVKKTGREVEILVNNNWLKIDGGFTFDERTPFILMIANKWERKISREEKLLKDEYHYKNEIRIKIFNYFNKITYDNVLEKMVHSFETKYIGKNCFEIRWEDRKFLFNKETKKFENVTYNEFMEIINWGSFDYGLEISICDNFSFEQSLDAYLFVIYKETSEYKLKNMYK